MRGAALGLSTHASTRKTRFSNASRGPLCISSFLRHPFAFKNLPLLGNAAHFAMNSTPIANAEKNTPKRSAPKKEHAMVHLHQVVKNFGGQSVLKKIDLHAMRQQVTVVMGGSGHGKSTLLKLIMGFISPDAGEIWVDGEEVSQMNARVRMKVRKKIGMAFQFAALFDSMSVYENCAFPLREHSKLKEDEIAEQVHQNLSRVGLPGVEEKFPAELSGGMKKRVGVARAMMLKPKILLFDEPESGLDPITTTAIGELIMEMRDKVGITCIVISHHLQNSMTIADQMCMLYRGEIIARGSPKDMTKNDNPILQQFLQGSTNGPY